MTHIAVQEALDGKAVEWLEHVSDQQYEGRGGMPHVIVKLWPGKTEDQKRRLAQAITADVMKVLRYGEESVSVGFEEVDAEQWAEQVYRPDIIDKADTLYKKPGYTM